MTINFPDLLEHEVRSSQLPNSQGLTVKREQQSEGADDLEKSTKRALIGEEGANENDMTAKEDEENAAAP